VQQFGVHAGAHEAAHCGPHGAGAVGGGAIGIAGGRAIGIAGGGAIGIGGGAGGSNRFGWVKPGKQHCGVQAGAHALLQPNGQVCGGGIGGSIGGGAISPQQLGAQPLAAHDEGHGAGQPDNVDGGAIGADDIAEQQSLLHDGKQSFEQLPEHPPATGLERGG